MRRTRHWLFVTQFCFFLTLTAVPVEAASLFYGFDFSGVVETAEGTSPPISLPSLVGQPFSAAFFIQKNSSGTFGFVDVATNLSDFVIPVLPPGTGFTITTTGATFVGNASIVVAGAPNYSGSVGFGAFSFVYNNGNPSSDSAFASIPMKSVGRADSNGNVDLTMQVTSASYSVSTVPLPPALPMFASALLALGLVGFFARKKHGTAILGAAPVGSPR
jgi:hypothetical protein